MRPEKSSAKALSKAKVEDELKVADKREAALRVAQGHQDAHHAVDTAKKKSEESVGGHIGNYGSARPGDETSSRQHGH